MSRRRFLKDAAVGSVALVFGGTTSGILAECYSKNLNSGVRKENNPNIIIILVDDMGYGDVQAFNPKSEIPTPNLNQLTEERYIPVSKFPHLLCFIPFLLDGFHFLCQINFAIFDFQFSNLRYQNIVQDFIYRFNTFLRSCQAQISNSKNICLSLKFTIQIPLFFH